MNNKEPTSFEMKIARRLDSKNKLNENGCYPFSEASINNIPNIDIFTDSVINRKITQGCKDVLRASMASKNKHRFGEMGVLISVLDIDSNGNRIPTVEEWFKGVYNKIELNNHKNFNKIINNIINNRDAKDLIFIHNHPNNGVFSAADLIILERYTNLLGIVAVGNTHNVFVAIKNSDHKSNKILQYVSKDVSNIKNEKERKRYMDKLALDIIKNANKFGIDFYKFNRRNTQ